MQFKHKLIYFALGCAFVVIAQVLLSIVVPKVTAQGKKMNFTEEMRKRGLLTEEYVQPTTSEPAERVDFTEAIRRHRQLAERTPLEQKMNWVEEMGKRGLFEVVFITLIIVGFSILGIVFRRKEIIKTIVAWFIIGVLLAVFGLVLVLGLSKLNLWVRTVPTIHFDWIWGYPRAETPLGLVLVLIGSGGFVSTVVVAIKRIVEEFRKQ